ncbi:MAG: AroM family protein [Thermoproteota archaeon]|jgi:allantoin racemase|nr:AroM family protein [Thermoproteota archaeon]
MKVCVIVPILKNEILEEITYKELENNKRKDTEISIVSLEMGPASIESAYDEEIAAPWILEKVKEAEERKFDAVIIDCMGDPALDAARELVNIPVIGPAQASMLLASMLGERFSIVTVLKNVVPLFWRLARKYGFESRLSSVRYVEVPVLEIENKKADVETKLINESKKAIEEDEADVIILGCTGFIGMARKIQETLHIPVVDPAPAALKLAESLIDLKLTTSKLAYPKPPLKERKI